MIKKNLKILIITSAVTLSPAVAGAILWHQLPQQMPMHWNAAGEVDGFYGKSFAVIWFPLIMLAFHWFCILCTLADPKKENHTSPIMRVVYWIIPVLSVLLGAVIYCAALGVELPIEKIIPAFIGLLLSVIGIFLPKCKQNYTVGFKLPWTLNSEENWNKTHRLAGWLWGIGGVVIAVACLLGGFWILFAALPIITLVPVIYSLTLYHKGI